MQVRLASLLSPVVALLAVGAFALVAPACGKDKPAEETPTVAPATEKPAEAEKPAADKAEGEKVGDADKVADGEKPEHERALAEDPKGRIRSARERLNGRRPQPLRHGVDGQPRPGTELGEGGTPPGVGEPGVPNVGEPGTPPPLVGEGEGGVNTPTPTPSPVVLTPVAPTPTPAPEPVAPVAEGVPAGPVTATPGVEIRSEATNLDAAASLPLSTVTEIIGKTLAAGVPLQGIAIVPGYGSVLYAAADAAKFGVALQVWQDPTRRESDDRFRRMRLQYPNAQDVNVLTPSKAFFSYFETIQSLTWIDPTKRIVASVTCGDSSCNQEQLVRLAKAARERL